MATLLNVIDFLSGFSDDEMQTGVADLIAAAQRAEELLINNLSAWQDEEDSVQEEHLSLIEETANFLEGMNETVPKSQLAEVIRSIIASSDANDHGSLMNAIIDAKALIERMEGN